MNKKLENELIREKIKFTKICVNHILNSTNQKWSSEQRDFIDALYQTHEEWRKLKI